MSRRFFGSGRRKETARSDARPETMSVRNNQRVPALDVDSEPERNAASLIADLLDRFVSKPALPPHHASASASLALEPPKSRWATINTAFIPRPVTQESVWTITNSIDETRLYSSLRSDRHLRHKRGQRHRPPQRMPAEWIVNVNGEGIGARGGRREIRTPDPLGVNEML